MMTVKLLNFYFQLIFRWVEQDANFIIESVDQTIAKAIENLKEQNIDYHDIKCMLIEMNII